MPDPMFQSLYHETGRLRWPSAEDVRRRGRLAGQRRMAWVAAAAAVAVLTGGAIAERSLRREAPLPPIGVASTDASSSASGSSSPSASASASPSAARSSPTPTRPSGTEIPASAMLQPEDLPAGYRLRDENADGDWTFAFSVSRCRQQWSFIHPVAVRSRAFTGDQRDTAILQQVYRYRAADDASRYLADVRAQALRCGGPIAVEVVGEGFAGDESLLVHVVFEAGFESLHIFVRQGDLVAEVWAKPTPDRQEAIRLAQRAAARLCNATSC